ncbi:hypothetical protein DRN34_05365 [Thermococci archaeon]|nr:MAG: hypothetical protein DRN34_05365 [Thermococci archaeon]
MEKEEKIIGAAFPIPKPLLKRILEEGKDVFVKPATLTRLKPGMKIIFYASREDQGFYGEAEVESIELFENPLKILEKYKDRIFLTEKEFKEYIKTSERWRTKGRRARPWIAVVLKNIKKYSKVVKPKRFIAVSGRYVKEKEYQEIQKQF